MKVLIFLFLPIVLIGCGAITYMDPEESNPQYAEPGKCYARCLIQDEVEIQTHKYYRYTGEDAADNPNVIETEVVVNGSRTRWEKKKAERN